MGNSIDYNAILKQVEKAIENNDVNALEAIDELNPGVFEQKLAIDGKPFQIGGYGLIYAATTPGIKGEIFEALAAFGADHMYQNKDGNTCLMRLVTRYAILEENREHYKDLVQSTISDLKGICTLQKMNEDQTNKKVTELVNLRNNKQESPLDATKYEKPMRDLLIRNGADINSKDKDGKTCGHKIIERVKKDSSLEQKNAAITNVTPLIRDGLDPNIKDNKGNSVISIITECISKDAAKQLKNEHAQFQARMEGKNIANFVKKTGKENIANQSHDERQQESKKKSGLGKFFGM